MTDVGPVFNQLLASRYAELVRKIAGNDIRLDTVVPELAMGVTLESDRPEFHILSGSLLLAAGDTSAIVAAQNSIARLRVPPAADVFAVVEEIWITCDVAGVVQMGLLFNQPDLTVSVQKDPRDLRIGSLLNAGVATPSHGNNIAAAGQFFRSAVAVNVPLVYRNPIILAPNWSLNIFTAAVQVGLSYSFVWRERKPLPEERTEG